MEKIFHKKTLIGIRFGKMPKGTVPVTQESQPLQMLTLKHQKGTYLKAHMHKSKKRVTKNLQECLIVLKGRIKIDLYGKDKKLFKSIFLNQGQVFILLSGGYGIHVMKDAELIEVKNGPFIEDKILI